MFMRLSSNYEDLVTILFVILPNDDELNIETNIF